MRRQLKTNVRHNIEIYIIQKAWQKKTAGGVYINQRDDERRQVYS